MMLLFYLSLIETEDGRAKFEKIYEIYLDWMLQTAYHYVRNLEDAKDIVHDVFMDIIKTNSSIPVDNSDETKSYLFICIRNRISKVKIFKTKLSTVSFDAINNISAGKNVEQEVVNKIASTQLQDFVDSMSPIYRDILALYFFHSLSLKEISIHLHIPFNTVATRFKRGRNILKERFKELDI